MAAHSLQQELLVGGGDFVAKMHQAARRNRVFLACNADTWIQRGYSLPDAINQARAWSIIEAPDCYASANGFTWDKGSGRTVSAVRAINGFYVDFDRQHQPGLKDLTPADFLNTVMRENPWLPVPTIFEDSGRGCWMFWLFERPLIVNSPSTARFNFMAQWQVLQDFLIAKLRPYGADPQCSDLARVVRLAGTENSKAGKLAQAWTTGARYKFTDLKSAINAEFRRDNPKRDVVPTERNRRSERAGSATGSVSRLFSGFSLAHARMHDLRRLAAIRGGQLTEHRRMAIWMYATFAAQFCRIEDTLRAEVDHFISECVAQPEKYRQAINIESTIKRFRAEHEAVSSGLSRREARERLGWGGSCYRLSNRYIIDRLDIDDREQRKLKTIIGAAEKQRRNTASQRSKRREAGVKARADYLERAQQRRLQAARLRAEGLSVQAIAEHTGMSVRTVYRHLVDR